MKRYVKLCCAALVLTLLLGTTAQAATVVWPAVTLEPIEFGTATHTIASGISPVGSAVVMLEIVCNSGPQYSLQAYNIMPGIRHWWFATQHGAALDASALVNADYLANAETMEPGSVDMPLNQIFYLGFRLDGGQYLPPYHIPSHYIYGWAALLWNGTDLTLVGSAAETTGAGIYAGTYNAIPEPSAAGLLLAGLAALAMRRRHTRRPGG